MRGPGLRVKNDVRRIWRCPVCLQVRRLPANIVNACCACRQPHPQMQLVESRRSVRIEQPPLPPYIAFEELLGEESSSATEPARDSLTHLDEVVNETAETDEADQLPPAISLEDPPELETGASDAQL